MTNDYLSASELRRARKILDDVLARRRRDPEGGSLALAQALDSYDHASKEIRRILASEPRSRP